MGAFLVCLIIVSQNNTTVAHNHGSTNGEKEEDTVKPKSCSPSHAKAPLFIPPKPKSSFEKADSFQNLLIKGVFTDSYFVVKVKVLFSDIGQFNY